jgi:hypothetical protein
MNLLSSAELPTKAPKEEIEKRKKRIEWRKTESKKSIEGTGGGRERNGKKLMMRNKKPLLSAV